MRDRRHTNNKKETEPGVSGGTVGSRSEHDSKRVRAQGNEILATGFALRVWGTLQWSPKSCAQRAVQISKRQARTSGSPKTLKLKGQAVGQG